ncbi:MAG: TlpA family protein disulfide reductase [Halobacteriota archaeon]
MILVDLFATWCSPCIRQMEALTAVHEAFRDDVAFISVTDEPLANGLTLDDIRSWWSEHGGNWTVGHDPEGRVMAALGGNSLPFLAVLDARGDVVWTHSGVAGEAQLRANVERALKGDT